MDRPLSKRSEIISELYKGFLILLQSQRPFDELGNDEPRENYNHWRKERDHIDHDRIQRQKTKEGWKREWDWNKHENQ